MNTMRTIKVVEPTDVLWKRVGAFLIDQAIYLGAVVLAARILPGWIGSVLTAVFAVALWAAMFVVLQGATGATPGKLLVGLRVVTRDGEICGPGQALIRSLAWVVDGFPYVLPLAGYAAAFGDKDAQRLGDRWAHTYVVDRKFVGQQPFAVAFPADGSEPYLMTQRAAYLPTNAVNPLKHTLSPTPACPELVAPSDASPRKPSAAAVFDPDLKGYKRWDAVHNTWAYFDEESRQWQPAPVTLRR